MVMWRERAYLGIIKGNSRQLRSLITPLFAGTLLTLVSDFRSVPYCWLRLTLPLAYQ